MKERIDVITMGCSKNLIDSERLLRQLAAKGYDMRHDPETPSGKYVVVNTCGFIADAQEESINMILELCELKKRGDIGSLVVMGCLSQRFMDELRGEMPEVDRWYGKFDWKDFITSLPDIKRESRPKDWERQLTTPPHSAYVKISEGCNRFCAFCAIPIITGRHTSRPEEEILAEVESLVNEGVKEFNIIAQDLSSYGTDLYGENRLARLIDHMADIPGVRWIRLHYAYPADFPLDVLDVMARRENVCKYLDIALQHASDKVLDNMRRHITRKQTEELLDEMRRRVPGLKLRTTLMVGFPGEGEAEFEELMDFAARQRFERMGAFAYCEEQDTYSAKNLPDIIPDEVKQQRLDRLMLLQEEISLQRQKEMEGMVTDVMIDRIEPDGTAIGRTQWDSPEVDPEVLIPGCSLEPGSFTKVRITKAYPFELEGELVK